LFIFFQKNKLFYYSQYNRNVSLIFENVVDPHNVAACLRTADIFGIQDIHVIEKFSSRFTVKK